MVFSSLKFIFHFLPIFLTLYYISPGKWKNLCLFAGSLLFYFYGVQDHPGYLFLLFFSILVNYKIGICLGRRRWKTRRASWLIIGIIYNLFWLLLFKYAAFFTENINLLLQQFGFKYALPVYHITLPIGISFYTFQAISYLTDVYRRDIPCETSFIDFGMYINMFPQLIAGPIVTYASIQKQISRRKHTLLNIEEGLREFTIGLGFKVLLANQVGKLWSEVTAIGYESISTPLAWLGLAAYSFQIYFDFYGYSLMAQGLGKLMGFHLPDNFHHPYMALSMTEFWRKWHMTLGSWFREYIYIPNGGNRMGSLLTFRNMLIVWLLTGFWHGASWNFILWGFILFILISAEKLGLIKLFHGFPVIGHLYMLFAIPVTWLIFAVSDLKQMLVYFLRLFPFMSPNQHFMYYAGDFLKYGKLYFLSLAAGLIFITSIPRKIYDLYKNSFITAVLLLVIFWLYVYFMKMGADDPFLYFRF